jgi:hypothetical protein
VSDDEIAEVIARWSNLATPELFAVYALSDIRRLLRHIDTRDARFRDEMAWLTDAVESEQNGRGDDREAVVAYLRALGHVEAAEAIAKAGYPLFACLPPVTEETMKKVGGNTP